MPSLIAHTPVVSFRKGSRCRSAGNMPPCSLRQHLLMCQQLFKAKITLYFHTSQHALLAFYEQASAFLDLRSYPFSLHPSTHGLSLKDLCIPISSSRLQQCVYFFCDRKQSLIIEMNIIDNLKLYFFLHALIMMTVFNEQSHFLTEGLIL